VCTTWSLSGIVSPAALAALIIALPVLLPRNIGALVPIVGMGNGTPLVIVVDAFAFFLCAAVLVRSELVTSGTADDASPSRPRSLPCVRHFQNELC
jgi:hypothetical protein